MVVEPARILDTLKPIYLNTDLDVRARFDLGPLHAELSGFGFDGWSVEKRNGVWEATFNWRRHTYPSQAIDGMLGVVARLSPEGRKLWDACLARRFNIGYGYEDQPFNWSHSAHQLRPALLARLAVAGASVVLTIYRTDMKGIQATS